MDLRHSRYVLLFTLALGTSGCLGGVDGLHLRSIAGLEATVVDDFDDYTGAPWASGKAYGHWVVGFTGYGHVAVDEVDGDRALTMEPRAAEGPESTHAGLVVSLEEFEDLEVEAVTRTSRQVREGSEPNPWEVGWLVWDYTDNHHFYYVIAKPNGWELGKRDPAYPGGQRFLATGSSPSFPVGDDVHLRVRRVGTTIHVWADDVHLVTFTDDERPYTGGAVALYTEDAAVLWDDVRITEL